MNRGIAPCVVLAVCASLGCASSLGIPSPLLDASAAAPEIREDRPGSLPAVEGLRARSGELRAVALRWQPLLAGPVSGYAVDRALSDDGEFQRVAVLGGAFSTRWIDRGPAERGLEDGQAYHYRVRAIASDGALGALNGSVPGTTATLPDRPRGVSAISQLPRRVALSWDPSPDPTVAGYRVSRSPSALGEFRDVAELEGRFNTGIMDEGLGDLRVFYYRVAAVNAAGGVGDPSAPERAVTKPEPLPPDGVEAVAHALGRNRIRWRPNVEPDVAGYRIRRITDGAAVEVAELAADVTEFEDDGLGAGEPVAYSMRAFDRDGLVSNESGPFEVTSVSYGLAAAVTADGVVLTWDPIAQTPLTETRVMIVSRFSREEVGRATEARFVDADITPGPRRYQLVGVRDDGSEAPPSALADVEILAPPSD